jgi:hypothetical protein
MIPGISPSDLPGVFLIDPCFFPEHRIRKIIGNAGWVILTTGFLLSASKI